MAWFSSIPITSLFDTLKKVPCAFLFLLLFVSPLIGGCDAGIYHTVKSGQTLYRISRTYKIDEDYLARVNGIYDPSQISVGTRIFIPGADHVLSVPVVKSKTTVSTSKKKPTVKTAVKKKSPVRKSTARKTQPRVAKKKTSKHQATPLKKLQWPLRGKIIRSFSSQAKAGRGHGIEIAARSGSTVKAAEAGKVIYSGDGVNGYAFLVILQHENDLFTVYGFNRKTLVKQGDFVSRGERIALSGTPPAGGQPRLHFEVRKGKRAVNPMKYLP